MGEGVGDGLDETEAVLDGDELADVVCSAAPTPLGSLQLVVTSTTPSNAQSNQRFVCRCIELASILLCYDRDTYNKGSPIWGGNSTCVTRLWH
ncbi:MAG TPA: hypothetical protein VHJ82_05625 [Actinomycetota bacterium]|nr:hypothetical protein [Actinomycetota bacterium]